MKQTRAAKHQAEGQKPIDRESVKMLAISVGVREAARQLQIPQATVQAWSARGKWFKAPELPPTITNPRSATVATTRPSNALQTILNERKDQSKTNLSKYVAEATGRAAESNGNLKLARAVKDVAAIHSTLWPEVAEGNGTMPGLQVFSRQTVINVSERSSNSASDA